MKQTGPSMRDETREALLSWSKHDDEAERFCVVDGSLLNSKGGALWTDHSSETDSWILQTLICPPLPPHKHSSSDLRPYTIRRPPIPNSFHSGSGSEAKTFYSWLEGQCVEKRAFYRLISGLHASINIHLSTRYLLDDSWFQKKWGHNVSEFRQRFDAELTAMRRAQEAPQPLLPLPDIELRALAKALPFFQQFILVSSCNN
ncbi:hypothetical protein L3Q82_008536 [Scortum barcoo]|uniref:Uncharacterized protein n=1 Tax=Scortum barcoo TaxID=214431 RepID=A0ACB8XES4_9TELE|nr:hypothetical protein L3Q82_008536 [Scortum barcoo]